MPCIPLTDGQGRIIGIACTRGRRDGPPQKIGDVMPRTGEGTCRWCGAKVYWAVMEKSGKAAPIDYEPNDRGNVVLSRSAADGTITARMADPGAELPAGAKRRMNHWATCPKAKQHSRR